MREIEYKRVKTPTIMQMEMVECGAASLAMIMAYYKKFVPLEKLRIECGINRDGVKAGNIVRAARRFGFDAKGYRKELEDLKLMKPPMIIHWNFNHFVVLEGIKKDKVYLNDPAIGRRKVSMQELSDSFTGIVLVFTPNNEFRKGGKPVSFFSSLNSRLGKTKSVIVYLFIIGLLIVIPGIIIPSFSRIFIDEILLAGRTSWLKSLLWIMGLTVILQILLISIQQKYLLKMNTKLAINGSSKFFWHILRLPLEFFQQRAVGDINSRMNSNDSVAQFLSEELAENVIRIISILFYFIIMLQYSVMLTIASTCFAAVTVFYFIFSSKKVEDLNMKTMQDFGKLYGFSLSGLHIIETLKATASESSFFSKWSGYYTNQINGQQKLGATSQLLFSLPTFMMSLSDVMVLCLGGYEIMKGRMTVGSLVAFQTLLSSFMMPISNLTQMGMKIKQLKADMGRLDDVMKYEIDKINKVEVNDVNKQLDNSSLTKLQGDIEIKNLSFGYNVLEEPLIKDFNLNIKSGSRVALVGASGSGKSTVAKIISGLYKSWSGEILFDGILKEDINRAVINNSISVVDQNISIFTGTIMDNITMWDSTINESSCVKAAKDAEIHSDIMKLDDGYNHIVNEDGSNFSGGQRQRLEIARALAINPSILIMDEATSALDAIVEQKIDENIRSRGCTCIIVAHRLSTIRDCDEIIVMDNGKIVQRGTHNNMKDIDGPYKSLISSSI